MMKDVWRIWDKENSYGDVFKKRLEGKLPEMESSKAVTKIIKKLTADIHQPCILDAGCGAAHYLLSLDRGLDKDFRYIGIDQTQYYVDQFSAAKDTLQFQNVVSSEVRLGDLFGIPIQDATVDVVMCNNVLLHLPKIQKPIEELVRVSKKYVVIRTLIGESTFIIRQAKKPEVFINDELENYYYFNIYSKEYICNILGGLGVKSFEFIQDVDFDEKALGKRVFEEEKQPLDLTTSINGMQVNQQIIQPWYFIVIEK